jgi:hypothetical protein
MFMAAIMGEALPQFRRHPGLVPGSTVPHIQRSMLKQPGGCRDKRGMTVEANERWCG